MLQLLPLFHKFYGKNKTNIRLHKIDNLLLYICPFVLVFFFALKVLQKDLKDENITKLNFLLDGQF
jgi:hypothetical protein